LRRGRRTAIFHDLTLSNLSKKVVEFFSLSFLFVVRVEW
jgi:hypothetical protein